jgi:hypothetical protein
VNTGGIRGVVTADDGQPMAMAEVRLTHEPTGVTQKAYTNDSGAYSFTGLRVGGPYSILVEFDGYQPNGAAQIHVSAGKPMNVPVRLELAGQEVIEVVGTATSRATSGRSVFGGKQLSDLPTSTRDPKEVVRLNPETVVEGSDGKMFIGGANNRFNSVTIDGIRQDDDFGLNRTGYPTQGSPIALSAIEEIAVETAPFDVRYGRFLGGNVNIVTKSGTNEFQGQLIGSFINQSLTGTHTKSRNLNTDNFREIRYGGTFSGPIVEDRLHFLVSLEGLTSSTPVGVGTEGSGAANTKKNITGDDVARVQDIARRVYGIDAGTPGESTNEQDLKVLAKLDWTINPKHRVSTMYQRTGSNDIRPQLLDVSDRLALSSNWYDQREHFHAFSARAFSKWNSSLSTELEFSGKLTESRPTPLLGNGFMTAQVRTPQGGLIFLGPDQYRHRNELNNDLIHVKGQSEYLVGKHNFTTGIEYDRLSVYNFFVQAANGVAEYSSIDDFENMTPERLTYRGVPSGDIRDAAVNWDYGNYALYAQDQYDITSDFTVTGGVRTEIYQMGSPIVENPMFEERYGFKNTANLNGKSVIMPRLGMSYRPAEGLNIRAGVGLYSGGTPNVWLSNNYTNDGVTVDDITTSSADKGSLQNFNGRDVPANVVNQLTQGLGNVDALDPNFKIPRVWKSSLGFDYNFLDSYQLNATYTFGRTQHALVWQDLRRNLDSIPGNTPIGTAPDGRAIYSTDPETGFNTRRGFDILLTNATDKQPHSHIWTAQLSKTFGFGLSLFASYTYQDVHELFAAPNSQSSSNYALNPVGLDPENADLGISFYERKHRVLGVAQFERKLIGNLATSLGIVLETRSGQPFNYTFGGSQDSLGQLFGEERSMANARRMLFYVPKGDGSDVILSGIDEDEFNAYLKRTGLEKYRGQIVPKNAFNSPWFTKIDLRFAQDLPNPLTGNRARLMIDVENFGNLLNRNWGRYETNAPFTPVADVGIDMASGKYVYSNFDPNPDTTVDIFESVWRLQFTLMYDF